MPWWQPGPWRRISGLHSGPNSMLEIIQSFSCDQDWGVYDRAFQFLANPYIFLTYLLAEAQDLEALEVGQVLPSLDTVGLLGKVALGPLAVDLVLGPQLLDGASTGRTGELRDGEGSESGVGEGKNVTGHDLLLLTGGTVDQDLHRNSQ